MTRPHLLLPLLLLGWLAGCASLAGPPATRYALPEPPAAPAPTGAEAERVLTLRPLRLAAFLDVEGIVVQLDDITVHEASGHRWAEPLGRQLERGLRDRLAAALPATRVRLADEDGAAGDLALRLAVERFQGRPDGHALVAGRWQLRDTEGALLAAAPFRVATPLARDGYPALVRALGRGWDAVARELAEALRRRDG